MKNGWAIGTTPRFFDGRSEAAFVSTIELQAIDDDFNGAPGRYGIAWCDFVDVAHFAADVEPSISGAEQRFANFEKRFGTGNGDAIRNDGRLPLMIRDRLFCCLCRIDTHGGDLAVRTNRNGFAGKQCRKVRFEVGHGGDGRAGTFDGGATVDGNAGRDGIQLIDGWSFEALEELSRVGAEAFDETPLALGIEGIEGERRLARAGDTDDADELPGGEVEVDALEIVGARAA